ncbi:MAG TPA: protein kinase [Polyangiaceae bacterium]|nr:protein kinase [Polyangiaceae bacterium]
MALDPREPRLKGPTAFGPFVLERRLAVGGTAEVFLAHPKVGIAPAPHLVVKRLLPTTGEGTRYELLDREADLHRRVRHPNVVAVYGAGLVRGEPYLAMEYVEGLDLYRMLRRLDADDRDLPIELSIYIARQVAGALEAVHAAVDDAGRALKIVHRDVTPSNVYLSVKGEVKLGDFGIARVEEEARSTVGGLKGKFGYLAPEQVSGEEFDHRADLFALAAILGELLIGERVFPGGGQLAVLLAIRDGNIDPLRREAARLPPGLFELCEKGLHQDPDRRFQSARDLGAALEAFQTGRLENVTNELSEWVRWAQDQRELARKLEHKIRSSSQNLQAVRASSSVPELKATRPARRPSPPPVEILPRVRRGGPEAPQEEMTFARLIELIATGELHAHDEVSLMGGDFRRIAAIEELARHVLPSTTAVTGRVSGPGAPDYQFVLSDQSMLEALSLLRSKAESGALFVLRGGTGRGTRKEMYLDNGKLHHVASSERNELLGEYLVRRGSLSREDLEKALNALGHHGGRLGDTLVALGMVDAVDVFRAIRDQGRDRVAALCTWKDGLASFYRGTQPTHVEFPLELDLSSAIMAGLILAHEGDPKRALPDATARIVPGPRHASTNEPKEIGRAPASLISVARFAPERMSLEVLLDRISRSGEGPGPSPREAAAAVATAKLLGWIAYSTQ